MPLLLGAGDELLVEGLELLLLDLELLPDLVELLDRLGLELLLGCEYVFLCVVDLL